MQATPHNSFAQAEGSLLQPSDLTLIQVDRALTELVHGGDLADLYFERGRSEGWSILDRQVTSGSYSISQGVGARVVTGDRTGFAYSSDISPRALSAVVAAARGMARHRTDSAVAGGIGLGTVSPSHTLYAPVDLGDAEDARRKIQLLQDVDRLARAADPRIVRVNATLQCSDKVVLLATSEGTLVADVRPQTQLSLVVIAEHEGKKSRGSASMGGRFSRSELRDRFLSDLIARATRIALVNLDARPAPAGTMSVVLGPGFPGILLHEAVGHGLEGDAHRKRSSVFTGKSGSRIAAPDVTVIDDGSLADRLGSLNMDDEGVLTRPTALIEDGILSGLMQDRLNSGLMKQAPTGNGRRQSYAHLPMPRMTNTYLAAGNHDPAEIVASVKNGIYAADFGGGAVDITSGQFNFSATEAYLIEDGKITAPIEGATLIGLGHEALSRISMVGTDLRFDNGVCGKEGQSVQVCVGQPTVRIDNMVVGGRR